MSTRLLSPGIRADLKNSSKALAPPAYPTGLDREYPVLRFNGRAVYGTTMPGNAWKKMSLEMQTHTLNVACTVRKLSYQTNVVDVSVVRKRDGAKQITGA